MPRKKTLTLTNAEHRIMEVIWAKGSATVADVVEALNGKDAYTTILTLMTILKGKGYLSSRKEGRAFVFVDSAGPMPPLVTRHGFAPWCFWFCSSWHTVFFIHVLPRSNEETTLAPHRRQSKRLAHPT